MLTAYLDESGHEGRDLMVLAGFLGDSHQWKKCEENWRIGLGKVKHLHMTTLRWSKVKRIGKLLARLGPVPHEAGLRAVVSTVAMRDYDDLIEGTELEIVFRSYMVALMGMINLISTTIPPDETFKLVLEANDNYQMRVESLFRATEDHRTPDGRRKLVSIEFIEKAATVLTEPADYLSFALLQSFRDANSEKSRLCAPILDNTQSALVRQHERQPDLLRNLMRDSAERYPHMMRKIK